MPTKQQRLNVVIEPSVYQAIEKLAKKGKMSLSLVARDLIREALEIYEDSYWARIAEGREKTLRHRKLVPHAEVWKTRKR